MSNAANTITLIGRAADAPEVKRPNGTAIARISLAVDRSRKDAMGNKQTDWFKVIFFGKSAEVVEQYVIKGKQLAVTGSMVNDKWTDRDGNKRDGWVVEADAFTLLGGPDSASGDRQQQTQGKRAPSGDVIPF